MIGVFVGFSCVFLLGILIFKGLTARRLYKLFGVKGLISNPTGAVVDYIMYLTLYLWSCCILLYFTVDYSGRYEVLFSGKLR
jgi:hypothetical protein